jgi:prophage regulatory protein
MSTFILRLSDVIARTKLSKSEIYRRAGVDFPSPIKLGERSSGWLEADIEDWIAERVKYSRLRQLQAA